MKIAATEAAFEGFRLSRRRPGAVALWGAVWLVGLIAMLLAVMPLLAPHMGELGASGGDPAKLSPAATAAMQRITWVTIPVLILLQAVLAPAVYRAVLRPQEKSFASLRVGRDEGRLLIVALVVGCVSAVANVGGEIIVNASVAGGGMIVGALVWLVVTGVTIWLSVRLCLIAPLSFHRRRLAFVEGWKVTRPLFWPLLGLNIIVFALAAVVVLLLILIGWPLQVVMASGGPASPGAAIGALLILILLPLGMAMVSTLLWAPFAAICRDIPESR
ncbi:hypothetical protein [Brevundimonas sp. GCM10030266]|uniref:hypothetical protein n=1 Tax=Brevundimonas sp. GCM10030266 TaxID=3273386 RepID=UPI0036126333